jgi:hypothetical protein
MRLGWESQDASPEGDRLLAQGVSPGERAPKALRAPPGAAEIQGSRSEKEVCRPWRGSGEGGVLLPRADALG